MTAAGLHTVDSNSIQVTMTIAASDMTAEEVEFVYQILSLDQLESIQEEALQLDCGTHCAVCDRQYSICINSCPSDPRYGAACRSECVDSYRYCRGD